jgi:preprotein translocase subunit YajC
MSLDTFLLAMAAPQNGANPLISFLPLLAMLAIFYFILVLPMKKKQQKVQAFLQALKEGDRVVTSGGMFGTITRIKDEAIQLQIAQNVKVDVSKAAIVGYQGQPPVESNS